jgi:hypothetical protein
VKRLPGTLRLAVWWWAAVAAAAVVAGGASAANSGLASNAEHVGLLTLGVALGLLGLLVGWGTFQLARGKLAGRGLLTTFGLIGGVPLMFRGAWLVALALALLVGVLLLWLPASMDFFKDQVRAARAERKAQRKASRADARRPRG